MSAPSEESLRDAREFLSGISPFHPGAVEALARLLDQARERERTAIADRLDRVADDQSRREHPILHHLEIRLIAGNIRRRQLPGDA